MNRRIKSYISPLLGQTNLKAVPGFKLTSSLVKEIQSQSCFMEMFEVFFSR